VKVKEFRYLTLQFKNLGLANLGQPALTRIQRAFWGGENLKAVLQQTLAISKPAKLSSIEAHLMSGVPVAPDQPLPWEKLFSYKFTDHKESLVFRLWKVVLAIVDLKVLTKDYEEQSKYYHGEKGDLLLVARSLKKVSPAEVMSAVDEMLLNL